MPTVATETLLPPSTANMEEFRREFDALNEAIKRSSVAVKKVLDDIFKGTAKLEKVIAETDGRDKDADPSEHLKDKLDTVIEKVTSTFRKNLEGRVDKVLDAFGDALEGALLGDKTKFKNLGETVKGELAALAQDTLKAVREQLREAIVAPLKKGLRSALDDMFANKEDGSTAGARGKGAATTGGPPSTAEGAPGPFGELTRALGPLVTGIRDTMAELLGGIVRGLAELGKGLGGALSGLMGGISEVLGGILSAGGKLFGGAFDTLGGALSGIFGGISSTLGGLFGGPREHGGPVAPGQAFLVGEAGPELLVPPMAGEIVPNRALGLRSPQQPVNQKFVINVSPGVPEAVRATILSLKPQIQQWAVEGVLAASMRGGAIARMPRI